MAKPTNPSKRPRIGFRHCDPRWPFLWLSADQPQARWHAPGEGPANYFADTPVGAWAEFLRHEEITEVVDLQGVRRSLWAVELPEAEFAIPELPQVALTGGVQTYKTCQAEARRLRATGAKALQAPAAALLPGGARGWPAGLDSQTEPEPERDGLVWVLFGQQALTGWPAVESGCPPASVLPLVRPLAES
jgi:RES domain